MTACTTKSNILKLVTFTPLGGEPRRGGRKLISAPCRHADGKQAVRGRSGRGWPRCLIPRCGDTYDHHAARDALWVRFFTEAPQRRRRSVARYSYVKRA